MEQSNFSNMHLWNIIIIGQPSCHLSSCIFTSCCRKLDDCSSLGCCQFSHESLQSLKAVPSLDLAPDSHGLSKDVSNASWSPFESPVSAVSSASTLETSLKCPLFFSQTLCTSPYPPDCLADLCWTRSWQGRTGALSQGTKTRSAAS